MLSRDNNTITQPSATRIIQRLSDNQNQNLSCFLNIFVEAGRKSADYCIRNTSFLDNNMIPIYKKPKCLLKCEASF